MRACVWAWCGDNEGGRECVVSAPQMLLCRFFVDVVSDPPASYINKLPKADKVLIPVLKSACILVLFMFSVQEGDQT